MTDQADEKRGGKGHGPESGRRVRGKPGTEASKEVARERDRSDKGTRRGTTPADPGEQTSFGGVEKELNEPFRDKDD